MPIERAAEPVAFVVCGALAREVSEIAARRGWRVSLVGVDALHHMRPERIAPDVDHQLRQLVGRFWRVVVIYGECGTRGALDATLQRFNVPRIAGPHCYEMYAADTFEATMRGRPGTFFLTDFLVRTYEGTVVKGLGLDRFPELADAYFGNYTGVVYLAQTHAPELQARAEAIAARLGLPLEVRHTGPGLLEARLAALMNEIHEDRYRPLVPAAAEDDAHGDLPDSLLARHSLAGARPGRRRSRQRAAPLALPEGD